jgi:hypothetical protein
MSYLALDRSCWPCDDMAPEGMVNYSDVGSSCAGIAVRSDMKNFCCTVDLFNIERGPGAR